MNIQTCTTLFPLLTLLALPLQGNEGSKLPLGATDLVPDQRFEEYKKQKSETVTFTVKTVDIDWDDAEIEGLETFQIDYPSTILELRIENEKMKEEISKLKLRLTRLEELLKQKSEPAASGQRR